MSASIARTDRIRSWFAHAFAVAPEDDGITPDETTIVDRLARFVVRRGMAAPAMMALESGRPFSFLGSQVLTFFGPFAMLVFKEEEYERFTRLLEKRGSIPYLIDRIAAEEDRLNG